jgi:nicotinamide-nucleotide amidase
MLAELITIGDEILIGQIVDTNSAWMAQELNAIGVKVKQITSVSDNREHILAALHEASKRANIVLITGGLGPTKDDITKATLCDYFGGGLTFSDLQYAQVERLFRSFGREVTEINRKQAEIPERCELIVNFNGTAPGMWFEKDGIYFMSMPGVPYEMKAMMETQVIPKIRDTFSLPVIVHRTFLTQGIGESMLSEMITDWEDALPKHMKLAYLPSPGMVRLRISALGENELQVASEVQQQATSLYNLIGQHIYGEGDQTIEAILLEKLRKDKKTLSLAESCTGGNIAHLLTSIPGASDAFVGGAVVYTNTMKVDVLGVNPQTLTNYGVVSEEVVREMAHGAIQKFNSDYAIAVSGVAGPGADKDGNPVGSVWIAIAGKEFTNAKKFQFSTNRERNITMSSYAALNYLRKQLIAY